MRLRFVWLFCGILASLPASAQTIIGVLGGTAVNADDPGAVVTIDPTTGAATVLGTPIAGESLTGVARLGDGRVVASTATFEGNSRLIEIDPATGALIQTIGDFTVDKTLVTMHDLTVDPATGILYGISVGEVDRPAGRGDGGHPRGGEAVTGAGSPGDANAIFRIDPATAVSTFIGTPGSPAGFMPFAVAAGHFWGLPADDATLYRLQLAGAGQVGATPVTGTSGDGALGMGLLEDGADPLFVFSACCEQGVGNAIFTLDSATGAATLLGPSGGSRRVHDLVVIPGTGPGPGTVVVEVPVLDGFGLAALAGLLALAGAALLFRR